MIVQKSNLKHISYKYKSRKWDKTHHILNNFDCKPFNNKIIILDIII